MRSISMMLSEKGPLRSLNADAALADDARGFYAVADGVGSSQGSVRASRFAVETAHALFVEALASRAAEVVDLGALVDRLSERFVGAFSSEPSIPATTLTLVAVTPQGVRYVSVGDSPIFLVDAQRVALLTREHTIVDSRRIYSNFSEMKSKPGSNVVANVLGASRPIPVIYSDLELEGAHRLILCTDGLMELYEQDQLSRLAAETIPLDRVLETIQARGRKANPPDNFTAIVVDLELGEPRHAL